jgi:hypothetical protein
MNYGKMFDMLDSIPSPGNNNQYPGMNTPTPYEPTFYDQPPVTSWEDAFTGFKTRPVLYNMDGWISPYASNNWGGTSNILQYIDDQSRLPTVEQKIDPNKIFSSELNGLRALAADQQKVVKMFERKLMENLTEKGKIGLTEEDIEAMSALTAARSAITSISKEQVAIKKNIADIRIKQAQNNGPVAGGQNGPVDKPFASMDIGRSILDSIFDAPTSSFDEGKDKTFYECLNTQVNKQCIVVTKSYLYKNDNGEYVTDTKALSKLNCQKYRIKKLTGFDKLDITTIDTVVEEIKEA